MLVTTKFHNPVAAPVIGQVPLVSKVELAKVNPVQVMLACPDIWSVTVAPEAKLFPAMEVMATEALFAAEYGTIESALTGAIPGLVVITSLG